MTTAVIPVPLEDRVVIELEESYSVTPGGIVLPDQAKKKPETGIVRAVGGGKCSDDGTLLPMHVGCGDRVLFTKYAGHEVEIYGCEYTILRQGDILAVLRD